MGFNSGFKGLRNNVVPCICLRTLWHIHGPILVTRFSKRRKSDHECHNAFRHIHGTKLFLKGKNDTRLTLGFFFSRYNSIRDIYMSFKMAYDCYWVPKITTQQQDAVEHHVNVNVGEGEISNRNYRGLNLVVFSLTTLQFEPISSGILPACCKSQKPHP